MNGVSQGAAAFCTFNRTISFACRFRLRKPPQGHSPHGEVDALFITGCDFLDHRFEQTTFKRITRC